MSLALGELGDEIKRDMLEWESVFGCWDAIDGGFLSMCEDFVLLASCTSGDVVR